MMRHALIYCLLVLIFTPSCTIRKRLHNGGFYIEWHKRHKKVRDNKETAHLPNPAEDTLNNPDSDTLILTEQPVINDSVTKPQEEKEPEAKKEKTKKPRKPFEPLGIKAAELLIIPVLIAVLDDHITDTKQHFSFSILIVVALSLCFILGIISMIRYLRNPKAYKLNIWAALAILIPLLYAVIALLGLSALF